MIIRIALVCSLALVACNKDSANTESAKTEPAKAAAASGDRFDIKVTDKGFEPDDVKVPAGKLVTFVFERKTEQTCAKEIVLTLADGSKIERKLPLDTPVEIATTFPTGGKVGYACSMDMIKGTITVQ